MGLKSSASHCNQFWKSWGPIWILDNWLIWHWIPSYCAVLLLQYGTAIESQPISRCTSMTDWLTRWLTDWSIHWMTEWRTGLTGNMTKSKHLTTYNALCSYAKIYAGDTCLVIQASMPHALQQELDHVAQCSVLYHLQPNRQRSKAMSFARPSGSDDHRPPLPYVTRVSSVNILGVNFTTDLKASSHIAGHIRTCSISI